MPCCPFRLLGLLELSCNIDVFGLFTLLLHLKLYIGSSCYRAPRAIVPSQAAVHSRATVFSLAICLFELPCSLKLRRAFSGYRAFLGYRAFSSHSAVSLRADVLSWATMHTRAIVLPLGVIVHHQAAMMSRFGAVLFPRATVPPRASVSPCA